MKLRHRICCLCLCLYASIIFGQAMSKDVGIPLICMGMGPGSDFEHSGPMSSWATSSHGGRSNITFVVNSPMPCPPKYTNVISNTNLFSFAERSLLAEIPAEYENVTSNALPMGAVFLGIERPNSSSPSPWLNRRSSILRFRYTNSDAELKLLFFNEARKQDGTAAIYRTKSGYGYDVVFTPNGISALRQFKDGQLDGLWADFEDGHCVDLLHFVKGKAVGRWLVWNEAGTLYMEAKFKTPYDLVGPISFH